MRVWKLTVEQNGGEYEGAVYIKAKNVLKTSDCVVMADDVMIDFGERVLDLNYEDIG